MVGIGEWKDEQRRQRWKMKSGCVTQTVEGPGFGHGGSVQASVKDTVLGGGEVRDLKATAVGRIITATEGTKSEGRTQHREADRGRR